MSPERLRLLVADDEPHARTLIRRYATGLSDVEIAGECESGDDLATSIGAAISMGFSEALSDTGELTGRGSPWSRGLITGGGTFLGGILHSLPFLISNYHAALFFAVAVVGLELLTLAYLRWKFFADTFVRALGIVTFAGVVIAAVAAGLGSLLGTPTGG